MSVGYSELFVLSREDVLAALKDHPDAEVCEPRHEKSSVLVSTWSDTNQAVQLQKMARGLKLRI